MPAAPAQMGDTLYSRLSYYTALQYLMLYRLGWSSPAQGLMRWYDLGKPTDDYTLALLSEVWDYDETLDYHLSWLLDRQPRFLVARGKVHWPEKPPELNRHWDAWLRNAQRKYYPLGGGDPYYLTGHLGEYGESDPEACISVLSKADRTAIFVTGTMNSWYWDLRKKMLTLPAVNGSWKVDVFVRPVGFLGTYRLSWETQLPYVGRHRYYELGN